MRCCRKRSGKELDQLVIPCQLTNKTVCKCIDPCLAQLLLEFLIRLNFVKNQTYCPSSTQGIQSSQSGGRFFGPTRIKWKTEYYVSTGKKLVLSQDEMRCLYDYMNTKNSVFGRIVREFLNQQQAKRFARQKVFCPSSEQGVQSSQQGDLFFCVKVPHRYPRKIKSANHENCCQTAKKVCGGCSKAKCQETRCY